MKPNGHPWSRSPLPRLALVLLIATALAPAVLGARATTRPAAPGKPRPGSAKAPREIVLPFRDPSNGNRPAFSHDSATLFWWDGRGIGIWDLAREELVGTLEPASYLFVLSPDGSKLAADVVRHEAPGHPGRVIKVFDVATRKELYQLEPPPGGRDKNRVFGTCGFDRTSTKLFTQTDVDLQVWDVKTGGMLRRLAPRVPPAHNYARRSPDGRYFTVDNGDASADVLDTETEKFLTLSTSIEDLKKALGKPRGGFASSLGSWSFSGDGRTVYATDQLSAMLFGWSLPDGKMINAVRIPGMIFADVSPDTTRILVRNGLGEDRSLRVLDSRTLRPVATLGPMKGSVDFYAISPDNRWVFTSAKGEKYAGDTRLWDLGAPPAPKGRAATTRPATQPAKGSRRA